MFFSNYIAEYLIIFILAFLVRNMNELLNFFPHTELSTY